MKRVLLVCLLVSLVTLVGCPKKQPPTATVDVVGPTVPAVPNTGAPEGVAPTPLPPLDTGSVSIQPPPAPPAPPAGQRTHVVQRGETLWKIAGQYYGKSSQAGVAKIMAANPTVTSPDRISAGQRLVIPD